jgi:hypothetical protein
METIILEIIGLAVIANLLTHWFEPLQSIKYVLIEKLPQWLQTPFICSKCAGLWIGLAYFLNPIYAALVALSAYLIDNLIYYINNKKEL